jgi:hypothetical protein
MRAADTQSWSLLNWHNYSTWGSLRSSKRGQEDALRGWVNWLVQPLYGKCIPRLVRSTHEQGAQALANAPALAGRSCDICSVAGYDYEYCYLPYF